MTARQAKRRKRAPHRRKSVLVVDDEAGTIDVLIAVLADAGYKTHGAANGREALTKLAASSPDLVLLDYVMPVLDGADTLRAIRDDRRLAETPVVMMSGIPESMIKRRCRGYDAFLRKPFSLEELMGTVEKLLERVH